jgi:hypothetical protein
VCTTASADAVLNVSLLEQLLSQGNLKVQSGSAAQDIVVAVEISWSDGNALTLDAYRSLTITTPIAITGAGGLALLTNDGGTDGAFVIGGKGKVTFSNLADSLTINGNRYTLVGDIATLAADLYARSGGYFALANSYDASADGTYAAVPIKTGVNGIVEGLGNTISNVTIIPAYGSGQAFGLFGLIKEHGTVRDLAVTSISISGQAGGAGGLVSENDGNVIGCYSEGEITSYAESVGGLVAENDGAITDSEASASISVDAFFVGGLVGFSSGTITNSFARGSVTNNGGQGTGSNAGGLVGDYGGQITNSYSSGRVTGGQEVTVGGLLGGGGGTVSDSYWDTTSSGTTKSAGGIGLTNAQLQAGLPAGFDPSVWAETPGVMGGLPYLLTVPH